MTGPTDSGFRPRRWLRGPHFQTILPNWPSRRARVERRAQPMVAAARELLLDCGDGVTLQAYHSSPGGHEPGRKVAVILHGWEGSTDSTYMLSLAQTFFGAGYDTIRLNLRDHGVTHHLNRELFHSCRLPEVVGAVQALAMKFAGQPIVLAGFSLGGNFMLRVAAHRDARDLPLERVIAVSPVLDPAVTMQTLENGFPVYHSYFVRKWSRSLVKKQQAWPGQYDFDALLRTKSLRIMTDELVRAYTEYPTSADYLAGYAITGGRLTTLAAPATVLTSLDDPIIDNRDLARLAQSSNLDIVTTARGGHCGFIETLGASSWVDAKVLAIVAEPGQLGSGG